MSTQAISRRLVMMSTAAAGVALAASGGVALAQSAEAPISAEALNAVQRMGKTLSMPTFSLRERTIREYLGKNGQPLHIFHAAEVIVHRPDRLSIQATGDDGATRLVYDGKDLTLLSETANKYASLPVTGGIEEALRTASARFGKDFPLADLLAPDPAKAFLADVSAGYAVNTVRIGGVPCLHLLFMQPPGIELELWVEDNDHALPRRLIVTYRSLPGEPRFVAELSDWKLGITPSDADFTLQIPPSASRIDLEKAGAR